MLAALSNVVSTLNRMNRSHTRNRYFFYLAALAGIVIMLPAIFLGMPNGPDLDNHLRFVLPFFDEISSGNFSPAWLAESNYGFGDTRFRFYPPLLYYFVCGIQFLFGNWYYSFLFSFALISVIGTVGIYLWVSQTLSKEVAYLSAAIFIIDRKSVV